MNDKLTIPDQDEYDRVTTVLSPFSGMNAIPKHILDAACARGTAVHKIIEAKICDVGIPNIEAELGDIGATLGGFIKSYDLWAEDKNSLRTASRFYDDKLQITGECDALYKSADGIVLVDFKTSAKEGKTWNLQGSAYSYLAKLEDFSIKRIEFVKLDKNGGKPHVYEYEENMDLFIKCLELYRLFFKKREEIDVEHL